MATGYHLNVKTVSRGKGQSIIAKAAYNAREQMRDELTGDLKDYRRGHSGVLFSGIFAPEHAPAWARDRSRLWNGVNAHEDRKNSRFAREIELAFPHQLTEQQREFMLKDFVRENFVREGMVADVNIHAPDKAGDQRNHHAHILLTLREFGPDGAFVKDKNRDWNSKEYLEGWREDWAEKSARMLTRAGYPVEAAQWRFAHLSLGEQRKAAIARGDQEFADSLKPEAGIHLGPHVTSMLAKGITTDRSDRAAAIDERNLAAGIEKAAGKAAKLAGAVLEKVVDVGIDLIEMTLDGVGGKSAPTPDDIKGRIHDKEKAEARREVEKVDLSRYLSDENYAAEVRRRQQEQERQERERDDYKRHHDPGRDR